MGIHACCVGIMVLCMSCCSANVDSLDTWAVVVSTSRYWHNYRHTVNALLMYGHLRRLGMHDDHIVLMLADTFACNNRNPHYACIMDNQGRDLAPDDIEVDYRGAEVTVDAFLQLLAPSADDAMRARGSRLRTSANSKIVVYLTGHGGEGFLKFHDVNELWASSLAEALEVMHVQHRFGELLLLIDTCHAQPMLDAITTPHVLAVTATITEQESRSVDASRELGTYVVDAFTQTLSTFLDAVQPTSAATLADMIVYLQPHRVHSTPYIRSDLYQRDLKSVKVTEFFSGGNPSIHDHRNNQKPHLLFESKPLTENRDQLRGTTSIRARTTTRNTPATTTMTANVTTTAAITASSAAADSSTSSTITSSTTTKSCTPSVAHESHRFPNRHQSNRFSRSFEAIMYLICALLFIVVCVSLF